MDLSPPAAAGSLAPRLATDDDGVIASWLEPVGDEGRPTGHRLRFARLADGRWSAPRTVAEGSDFFANWADVPSVIPLPNGRLVAHWLARVAAAPYAYTIRWARSSDRGESWEEVGVLPDDDSATEHGFVHLLAGPEGVEAFWLDGRAMADGGAMALRTRRLSVEDPAASASAGAFTEAAAAEPFAEEILDSRVCECCPLDAAQTDTGPLVVYRDRGVDEVRNIAIVRAVAGGWTEPVAVHEDAWKIAGCPVNGPAVAAAGRRVAVAWFTAPNDAPSVRAAISEDGGETFSPPIPIDAAAPIGRVDVALVDGAAVVAWLAAAGDTSELRLRRVDADGTVGAALTVAATSAARQAGFPRLVRRADHLYVAWVELRGDDPTRLRLVGLAADRVPHG